MATWRRAHWQRCWLRRRLVRERVLPAEAEIDETDEIPATLRAAAIQLGLFGFALPEQYGGLGLSMAEEVRLVIELGYTTPAFRSMFGTNNGIAGHVLMLSGTADQQARWLPRLASGDWTASFALTEPDAGSDPCVAVERLYRDARLFRLYDGTSQIQQVIIARELLDRARG